MQKKYNLLFFHPRGLFYGGTEKLLQILAKCLSSDFNVFYAYAPQYGEQQKDYFLGTAVKLLPYSFYSQRNCEPFDYQDLRPRLEKIIIDNHIHCICLPVYSQYQFPLNSISAAMPFILTSPFGHSSSNGNVRKIFVSGKSNLERLRRRGIKVAEQIMDPIEDFPPETLIKKPLTDRVVFGRVGRPDDNIFDPVSLLAFHMLEKKYGDKVCYNVVSPPPAMVLMAKELGVRNIIFTENHDINFLPTYYQQIDVFAHARKDGETFGKAIAEAMLAGLPIITHKSHGYNEHLELLDLSYARWSEPDDVEGYFRNMEWFVSHLEQVRAMGQLARQKILELCSPEAQLPHLREVFMEACEHCNYYQRGAFYRGKFKLWWNDLKLFPYLVAKRTVYRFPVLQKSALTFYKKIHS